MKLPIASRTKHFYSFGPFRLYVSERELFRGSEPVALPPKALDVLLVLVRHHGHVVDKDELMNTVWPDVLVEEASLAKQISLLRKEVGERPGGKPYIDTIARRGYRFAAVVTESWEEEAVEPRLEVAGGGDPRAGSKRRRVTNLSGTPSVLLVVAFGIIATMWWRWPEPPDAGPLLKFGFSPPVVLSTGGEYHPNDGISPNGRHLVFTGRAHHRLWVYDFDRGETRPIEGTEGADDPFWSPDSQFIGFFKGREIRKVPVQGGEPIRVCQPHGAPANPADTNDAHLRGGSWSPDGNSIVFSDRGSLYEVPARGGAPELVVSPEESGRPSGGPTGAIRWPHFLPPQAGARVLLYTFGSDTERTMMAHDLETGQSEILGPGELPFYSPSGHLLYQAGPRTYNLWALPFSLAALRAVGDAFPISQNSRHPTVSAGGTLTYVSIPRSTQEQLAWLDLRGHKTGDLGLKQERLADIALSPDGGLVAVSVWEDSNLDLWVLNIARSVKTRLSATPGWEGLPVWSPTGKEVAFTSSQVGDTTIVLRQADGSGKTEVLVSTPPNVRTCDWSRDGKSLLYEVQEPETGSDLWYLERSEESGDWERSPFLQTPFNECGAKLSPDSHHVAYVSDESGQSEVYVRPFPEGGRKWTVSSNGGERPRWSRDGQKLFYVEGNTLVAVPVSGRASFSVGSATRLFEHSKFADGDVYPRYDLSVDGQRVLLAEPVGEAAEPSIRVVQNWFAEHRNRQ